MHEIERELEAEISAGMRARLSATNDTPTRGRPTVFSYIGMGFDEIARLHLSRPEPATRTALLTLALMTRADAIAGLDLLLNSEDAFLCEKIIGKLRGYLSVM